MTILFFSRLFYPHIGGVEKHVLEVSKLLVKRGYSVTVLTEQYDNQLKKEDKIEGIRILRIDNGNDNWFKKFRVWKNLWIYRKLIKKSDIVHAHDVFFWFLPFRFLYHRKPVYTTFHGYETRFPPSKKAIFIRKISEKLSWGNICVGDYINKWYHTNSTFVTYGGVNIEIKNQSFDFAQGKKSRIKILFIGRLEVDTGVLLYLKTLDILKEKKINFELEAVGDGSLCSRVAQYGRVHRFVDNSQKYIQDSGIVFASSYLSILESLVYKKPVFSVYDNPLKEDYLKMSPFMKFIVVENDSSKLADKIGYYLDHKNEAQEKGNKGFELVKDKTWNTVADVYLKLWNKD